jgi:chromosome segregation ATPase
MSGADEKPDPALETGTRPRMAPEDAATLKAILDRVTGFGEVAENNRQLLDQLLKENSRIGRALAERATLDEQLLVRIATLVEEKNRAIYREVQNMRREVVERVERVERRQVELEREIHELKDREDAVRKELDELAREVAELKELDGQESDPTAPTSKG